MNVQTPQLFFPTLPPPIVLEATSTDETEGWETLGDALGVEDSVELTSSPSNPWAEADVRLQQRELLLKMQNEADRRSREAAYKARLDAEAAKAKEEAKKAAGAEE